MDGAGAGGTGARLNALLEQSGIAPLKPEIIEKFQIYLSLIIRWNTRFNLTSLRTEDAILSNHLAECVACAMAVPFGVRTLLDFGSGAGLPGIPVAICRPEIAVTLAESQNKKASFLQEAARSLEISVKVHAGRAEELKISFDCVTLRAVDKMPKAVATAAKLVAPKGWLALMTTNADLAGLQKAAGAGFSWSDSVRLPCGDERIMALGQLVSSPA
jgi:16S rRNA (guanine527-N7)-methyltransferase